MTIQILRHSWKAILDKQLCPGSPFAEARQQKDANGIPFKVQMVTPGGQHQLRAWEDELVEFLSEYGFELHVEHGVSLTPHRTYNADLVILLALSGDIESLC